MKVIFFLLSPVVYLFLFVTELFYRLFVLFDFIFLAVKHNGKTNNFKAVHLV